MSIQILDQVTIDQIAAGEVVERPASVIKELVENAIDAGATSITVEIREGGIAFMRIADNGCGIGRHEVASAFLRHSTSKIKSVDDLTSITSLGFRGEALSSIAAVAQVELITKTRESEAGVKYRIEGGVETLLEETGAPDGTTFLIHQLFYNMPARRKFLKTPVTEAGHISDLLTRLALSHPEISFRFASNGQAKLHTSGNGKLKDVIYHVYGREVCSQLLEIDFEKNGVHIKGFIGNPTISRGNRNYETYFINGRYVKDQTIYKAIEDSYKDFAMQHRYPFVVLHFTISGTDVDVNVHPTKMELRFSNQQEIYNLVYEAVFTGLHEKERIPVVELPSPPQAAAPAKEIPVTVNETPAWKSPVPVNKTPVKAPVDEDKDLDYFMARMKERVNAYHSGRVNQKEAPLPASVKEPQPVHVAESGNYHAPPKKQEETVKKVPEESGQMTLFEDQTFLKDTKVAYTLIGQVFDTYWLVQFEEQLYIIDQHAAHERVLYEKTLTGMKNREHTSQYINPPIVLNLTMMEAEILRSHMDQFERIGFEFESFGGDSYVVRAVPDNLFSIARQELLIEMLDGLSEGIQSKTEQSLIDEKIASMSCKAAVKGNQKLSAAEVDALIGELLLLENPYHCPHGRPTIIAMTKRELEKKFKRIV